MSNVNVADALKILDILTSVAGNIQEARARARAAALSAGASKEELDASDARFQKVYEDPRKADE